MEKFIKEVKALMPTEEQAHPNNPAYAFGWVDSINAVVKLVKESDFIPLVSNSCHCVIDEEENIVQLYSTKEKAEIGLAEFTKSHLETVFGIDEISIN
jgi:N-acetyl-anhydromuramyl-L-alanine amidase AmpD